MDVQTLRTFLELAKSLHFGRTAKKMFVTQSAVSTRIKQLEEMLGVTLFVREPRNVQLTEAGQKLQPYAETIVAAWSQARLKVAALEQGSTTICIGSVGSFWDSVLQDWFEQSVVSTRHVQFNVVLESNANLLDGLLNRSIDLAFIYDIPNHFTMQYQIIHELKLQLYTTHTQTETTSDAINGRYFLVDWGYHFISEHARLIGDHIVPLARVGQARIALNVLLNSGGAAYLPQTLAADYVNNDQLYPVSSAPVFSRPVYVCYRDDNPDQAALQQVLGDVNLFIN